MVFSLAGIVNGVDRMMVDSPAGGVNGGTLAIRVIGGKVLAIDISDSMDEPSASCSSSP